MNITVAIPTCVYPKGCKALLQSIVDGGRQPDRVVLLMDGNEGIWPLQSMPKYAERFMHVDPCATGSPTDIERLRKDNGDVQDYSFLADFEKSLPLEIHRHAENEGGVKTFDDLMHMSADADLVALVMDDEYVKPGWLDWMHNVFETYPNVVMGGYTNVVRGVRPLFAGVPLHNELASCLFWRGEYVRELLDERGWVFPHHMFNMVSGDNWVLTECRLRGYDLAMVATPCLAGSAGQHKSLGKWQADPINADHATEAKGLPGPSRTSHFCGGFLAVKMSDDEPIILDTIYEGDPYAK